MATEDDYSVCAMSENGVHVLDKNNVTPCKEIPGPDGDNTVLVDVWCALCGISGATRISIDQVDW